MKRWLTGVVVLAMAVALGLAWFLGAPDATPNGSADARPQGNAEAAGTSSVATAVPGAQVTGQVVQDGHGVRGARVVLRGQLPNVVLSGDDGRFTFPDVPPGSYVISASTRGLASPTVGPLLLASGGSVNDVVLTLTPAVQVEGVVIDLVTRAPIGGALVVSAQQVSKSDADGRFSLSGAAGATWLDLTAPGYVSRSEWVSLDLAKTGGRLEVVLTPASKLEGTVVEAGQPVAGATVWAEVVEGAGRGDRTSTVFTAKDGTFSLEAAAGTVRVLAVTPRGAKVNGPTLRLAVGEKKTGVVLDAGEFSAVTGLVQREGAPFSGAQVSAVGASNEDVVAVATTGPDGRFQFPALTNGRYLVQIRRGLFAAVAGPFEQTGDGRSWDIALAPGKVLSGRVEPPGPGVRVRWRSGTWSGPSADTVTDAQGAFTFEGLPPEYVSVDAEGPTGAATVRARAGDEVVLRLVKGQVIVHLADDVGRPMTDGVILSRSLDTGASRRQLVLAPDGVTRLDLPAGVWELSLEVAGRGRSSTARVEVRDVPLDVRLTLERSTVVTGVVRDAANGLPISGAYVEANSGTDGNAFRVSVTTNARGEFVLPPSPLGAMIVVRHEAYAPAWRPASEGSHWLVDLKAAPQHPGSSPAPQQFEGVGMVLDGRSGRVLVANVSDGGPAERAGVQRGDVVVAVDDTPTAGLPLDQVIGRIRGPAGTPVRLRFERAGQQFELTIRRRLLTL